ncbi:glycosyltransferase [Candidatus Pseudothioglobus singularis]|nr:glycosyltransferase [Candidatus Pseudothioglobus singularis]
MSIEISVVMSVHNNAKTLQSAIDSICAQTFANWELIIVDDYSQDESRNILGINSKNNKIKTIYNKKNIGLAKSLNLAVSMSDGEFIARMDADDISMPERLERQLAILKKKSLSVVGSNAILISEIGVEIGQTNLKINDKDLKGNILISNPFIHPSVVMTKDFFSLNNGYDELLRKKQDYDLWVRGINHGAYYNIEDPLIKYTVQPYKSIKTDFYGFLVRIRNGFRMRRPIYGFFVAVCIFSINILRKFGYRSRNISRLINTDLNNGN